MIETFVLNPPVKKYRRNKMARLKTRRSRLFGSNLADNTWFGHPILHRKAAKKAWRLHRPKMLAGVRKGARKRSGKRVSARRIKRARRGGATLWRRFATPYMRKYGKRGLKMASKQWKSGSHKVRKYVNNPIVPMPYADNKRKSRKSYRRHYKANARRSRRAKRSFLKRYVRNPALAGVITPVKTLISKQFILGTVLPITGGAIGSTILGNILYSKIKFLQKVPQPVVVLASGIIISGVTAVVFKKTDLAAKLLAGSAIAVLMGLLQAPVQKLVAKIPGMGELSADITSEVKSEIEKSIKEEIAKSGGTSAFVTSDEAGTSSFMTRETLPMSAFPTTEDLSGIDDVMGQPVF